MPLPKLHSRGIYARGPTNALHPHLWKDLIVAWVPQMGTGKGRYYLHNYAHRRGFESTNLMEGTVVSGNPWTNDVPGRVNNLASSYIHAGANITPIDTLTAQSFTWHMRVKTLSGVATARGIASIGDTLTDGTPFLYIQHTNDNQIRTYFNTNYRHTVTGLAAGTWKSLCFRYDHEHGNTSFFIDGTRGVGDQLTSGFGYGSVANGFFIGTGFGGYGLDKSAESYFYGRALTDGEIALLHRDAFAPLRTRPPQALKSIASGFSPAWANQATVLMG